MKVKKIISMLVIGTMTLSLLAGCGADKDEEKSDDTQQTSQSSEAAEENTENTQEEDTGDAAAGAAEGDGKTLVVYYSASGNTEKVANVIAEAAGADLFEVEPAEPYSDEDLDWTNDNSRVSVEHENESERDIELVSATVENWDSYDKVFIGYPIWWGIAAWPLNGFVEANDFTGKTVIPFCTSASSGLGESGELLADMAGAGEWQEGMRFRSGVSEEDVKSWVEGLGL